MLLAKKAALATAFNKSCQGLMAVSLLSPLTLLGTWAVGPPANTQLASLTLGGHSGSAARTFDKEILRTIQRPFREQQHQEEPQLSTSN